MLVSITVKWLGPTNRRCSRLKVYRSDWAASPCDVAFKPLTIPCDTFDNELAARGYPDDRPFNRYAYAVHLYLEQIKAGGFDWTNGGRTRWAIGSFHPTHGAVAVAVLSDGSSDVRGFGGEE